MRGPVQLSGTGTSAVVVDEFWLPTHGGDAAVARFRPADDPAGARSRTGVLIVGGIIHEHQTMAVGAVTLARQLAEHDIVAMTIDLAGTAQGAVELDAPDIGVRWDDEIRAAVRFLRGSGLQHVVVVGIRLGALIAAHATVDDPVDQLVMWAPVLSGRRYVRELQIMQASATEQTGPSRPGITVAGFTVPPTLVDHLKSLDAAKLDGKPASSVCFVDTAERLAELDRSHPLLEALPVETVEAPETERWLFTDADLFPVPFGDVTRGRRHVERVAASFDDDATPPPADGTSTIDAADPVSTSHVLEHDGVAIRETFVVFGDGALRGILSEPVGPVDPAASYVTVTSVGPGRIFVDFARREAARGRVSLRFELGGFGTSSPPARHAWAEFYHPTASDQIAAAVDLLLGRGHGGVTVVAFCAGAWSALQMTPRPEVAGIVAVNAQLLIRTRLLHRRPAPDHGRRHRWLLAVGGHPEVRRFVKKAEREFPWPSPAIRWVGRHVAAGTRVTLVYAEGDPGYDYFLARSRRPGGLRRRTAQPDVHVYPGLGHLPTGNARDHVLDDIHDLA